jgi:hypothetical protein
MYGAKGVWQLANFENNGKYKRHTTHLITLPLLSACLLNLGGSQALVSTVQALARQHQHPR